MADAQPSEYLCCTVCYPTLTLPTPTRLVIAAAVKLESKIYDRSPIQRFSPLIGMYCEAQVCREVWWTERSCSGDRGSARFNASAGHDNQPPRHIPLSIT